MFNIQTRCQSGGVPCIEVTARLVAAHKIKYQQGCDDDHADQLLATARRIAELHNWGNNTLRDAS